MQVQSAQSLMAGATAPQVILREFRLGNVFIREMLFTHKGTDVDGHAHNFDHVTYVSRGALLIEMLDDAGNVIKSAVKRAGEGLNFLLIKAGVKHRITALEDGSIGHCTYSHRNPQGEVVVEFDGWTPAYH